MKITNLTKRLTDPLRKIVQRVAEDELDEGERRILHVVFVDRDTVKKKASKVIAMKPPPTSYGDVRDAAHAVKSRYHIIITLRPRPKPDVLAWTLAMRFLRLQPTSVQHVRKDWDRYKRLNP